MTDLVHGRSERERAESAAAALFSGDVRSLDAATRADIAEDLPSSEHAISLLDEPGADLVDLLVATGLAKSKREAREFVASGAVSVNGEKADAERRLRRADLLDARGAGMILLRRGRKQWHATHWR